MTTPVSGNDSAAEKKPPNWVIGAFAAAAAVVVGLAVAISFGILPAQIFEKDGIFQNVSEDEKVFFSNQYAEREKTFFN